MARAVKLDDKLSIDKRAEAWEVRVLGISDVRGPAPVVRLLCQENESSVGRRENDQGAQAVSWAGYDHQGPADQA